MVWLGGIYSFLSHSVLTCHKNFCLANTLLLLSGPQRGGQEGQFAPRASGYRGPHKVRFLTSSLKETF